MDEFGLTVCWRYYREGGWLAKATKGSKTVAWLNVVPGGARVTCYFAERDRARLVENPALPADVRDRIAVVALIGKLLPVSLEVRESADVEVVCTTLRIKRRT